MNRAGKFVKNLSGDAEYMSYCPAKLPPELELNHDMVDKLVKANAALAKLDAAAAYIPNAELFVSMYVREEALLTSQIEGTQCTLEDVLNPQVDRNKNLDVGDVVNYINATTFALGRMESLPMCNRLFKEVHEKLMQGVRGEEKNPGEFRRSQNWIGAAGCPLKDARYIPPNVEDMQQAMGDLETYINEGSQYDPLIRIALIHYQFETIHPFLDGNGRIGRLMILLYLLSNKLLRSPVLYVSYFLKKNQLEYYDRMSEVRRTGNYEQWVSFFLEAVSAAAQDALATIEAMNKLHEKNIALLQLSKGKDSLKAVFIYLEQYPIIDIKGTSQKLGLSFNTVSKAVNQLLELGILKLYSNSRRNRTFAYEDYLAILRKDT